MDTDRGCAGCLDVHEVLSGDEHDVGSSCATVSTGDGRGGKRFQADPRDADAGSL